MKKNFDQDTITRFYEVWARLYRWLTPFYLLGNESRLRRRAVSALRLQPGQVVLDVACGTGRDFPYIMERIGPQGFLIGVDYTPAMLEEAEQLIGRNRWHNTALIRADAAAFALECRVDAALSTLAISVIPDYQEALQRMIAVVRPGGRVALAGARRSRRAYARPLNVVADGLGWGAAADLTREPWKMLAGMVEDFRFETFFLDFFYAAAGTIPPNNPD